MELNKVKSAAAIATLGLTGIMSGTAMANDIDTNRVAYDGLQAVQQHVQAAPKFDFNNPSIEIKSSMEIEKAETVNNVEGLVLPESVLASMESAPEPRDAAEDLDVELTSDSSNPETEMVPGAVDNGTDLESQIEGNVGEKSQKESCDREANKPSAWDYIRGYGLKGLGFGVTAKTGGAAIVVGHSLSRAGDYYLRNKCDEFEINVADEAYELGKTAVTAGMSNVAAIATDIAIDAAKEKIDEHLEEKEKEAKAAEAAAKAKTTVVADGQTEEVIPEVAVETTSEVSVETNEEVTVEAEPEATIGIKINRDFINKSRMESVDNEVKNAPSGLKFR